MAPTVAKRWVTRAVAAPMRAAAAAASQPAWPPPITITSKRRSIRPDPCNVDSKGRLVRAYCARTESAICPLVPANAGTRPHKEFPGFPAHRAISGAAQPHTIMGPNQAELFHVKHAKLAEHVGALPGPSWVRHTITEPDRPNSGTRPGQEEIVNKASKPS